MKLPAIEEVIPHRGPAVLLNEICSWEERTIRCRALIGDAFPYMREGRVRAATTFELMAQAVAAHVGVASRTRGEAITRGVVARARRLRLHVPFVTAGDALDVEAELVHATRALATYRCAVLRGAQPVADATLAVALVHDELAGAEEACTTPSS